MDITKKPYSIISICPGILGLERGLNRAISNRGGGINTVAYVEIESFIIANLVAQMECGLLAPAPIWTDVKTFDGQPFRDRIYGIVGGYPCQPFSRIGKQKGIDDERHLWPFIRTIVEQSRPFFCWFENVAAHIDQGFDEVYSDLSNLGYRIEAGIFTALEAGAPHKRSRLFILAIMDHTFGKGLEGFAGYDSATRGREKQERPITTAGFFPDAQCISQRPGEEPRVLFRDESSMDYTIDGYNYITDLHRAIGNSIVEQTAELAFNELLKKHIKNSRNGR